MRIENISGNNIIYFYGEQSFPLIRNKISGFASNFMFLLRNFPEMLRDPDLFNINIGTITLVAATFRSPLVAA